MVVDLHLSRLLVITCHRYIWQGVENVPEAIERITTQAVHGPPARTKQSKKPSHLGLLTERFMWVFLTATDHAVTLDEAAYVMCSEPTCFPSSNGHVPCQQLPADCCRYCVQPARRSVHT